MTTVISKNLVLSKAVMADEDTAGLVAYQNIVTPSTVLATSQTDTGPASNMANPATAWGWECSDQPAAADAIEYDAVNYMPSPFDPEEWRPDPDGDITNAALENPTGTGIIGVAEQTGAGYFSLNSSFFNPAAFASGDQVFMAIIVKQFTGSAIDSITFESYSNEGTLTFSRFNFISKTKESGTVNDYRFTELNDGFILIEVKVGTSIARTNCYAGFRAYAGSAIPAAGSKLYVQAAFFGKADGFPAKIKTQGVIEPQTITIQAGGAPVDYIGIARHNLNQVGLTLAVKYNGATVVPAAPVSDKQALLFLNSLASPTSIELVIEGATVPPKISVLYAGKYLKLQRSIYVGHTPITMGRDRTAINGVSVNGQYLGEIVVRETNSTQVNLKNLTPEWYRANLDPYFALSPRVPCFWAWRPTKYEAEVGYAWVEGNPKPVNQLSNGMMQIDWNFKGIV